jgi:hypothetical protein
LRIAFSEFVDCVYFIDAENISTPGVFGERIWENTKLGSQNTTRHGLDTDPQVLKGAESVMKCHGTREGSTSGLKQEPR